MPCTPTGLGIVPVSTSQTGKHSNSWGIGRLFRRDLLSSEKKLALH